MDISSDSNDTIILPLNNNEPSDTEVENILRKYCSTSSGFESKKDKSSQDKFYDLSESSDEDLNDIPLIKRVRKNDDKSHNMKFAKENGHCNSIKSESSLDNNDSYYNRNVKNRDSNNILNELCDKYNMSLINEKKNQEHNVVVLSDSSNSNDSADSLTFDKCLILNATHTEQKVNIDNVEHGQIFRNLSDNKMNKELEELSPKVAAKVKKRNEMNERRKERTMEKERKQEAAEQKKTMKNIEKERKKDLAEQQKAMKNALKNIEKSTKPDECIKHMIVEIDTKISQEEYGENLKTMLKSNNIHFKCKSQVLPKLISWCRELQTIENMLLKNTEINEKYFLLLMDVQEFSHHTRNNSLTPHIQKASTLTQCKHLTLVISGTDKARGDQDFAITEAQMITKCYFRFVKKSEDLAALVIELTKAIAQIPHKLKKEEKYMLHSEYFNDSNKDTVRVDKNGNGLGRLWHQMLTMFPMARLETAEAIAGAYPTPFLLFKAYDDCDLKKEELLQNLPIRRALGPCTSVRRIGPELSRKCFNFFCSTENILF